MKKSILVVFILCICGLFSANAHDLIVLKDGNIIEGKVMEIHPAEIRYKRSNNLNGPMIILPIDKVLSIKYENGVTDIINAPPVQKASQTGVSGSSVGQPVSMSAVLQASLNAMPAIPIAGNNLKFLFNGDTWTAMLNGENFSTGTISVEEAGNSSILTLKQTHIWPGAAVKTAGKLTGKIPGASGANNLAGNIAGAAGAVEASGPEIVLEYKAGPPAKLSFLRSQTANSAKTSKSEESVVVFAGNGHKYEIINTTKSWTNARLECEKRGGYLATITSDEEQKFIEDLLSKQGKKDAYWLGGYREGSWKWVTGESFVYSNWTSGKPDNFNASEDKIVHYRKGQWDDWNKGASAGFICEWD